ncbi:MAG: hypothetical protein V1855_02095 [bacterium]
MKKIDEFMNELDEKVDYKMKPFFTFVQKNFALFSTTILSLLFLLFVFKTYYNRPYFTAIIIKTDLKKISDALNKIDKDCSILSIPSDGVKIDFLTVKGFEGSVIGGINLAYPKKWNGPYEKMDPTMQQKHYELIKVADGFFIIPGKGVRLPNGLTLGKDFEIKSNTSIAEMTKPNGNLFYKGVVLAHKIPFEIGDWDSSSNKTKEKVNEFLEEFNEAMSFSKKEETTQTA